MISYPRSDADNYKKIYIDKDGIPLIKLKDGNHYVRYKDCTIKTYEYIKRTKAENDILRKEFNSSGRRHFLKEIGENNISDLQKAQFSDADIKLIQEGKVPKGYQVHHKDSLDDNGTNAFNNLILIKNKFAHTAITASQKSMTTGMKPGDKRLVDFVSPMDGLVVYPTDSNNAEIIKIDPL